jgi:hypothetical protein
MKTLTGQYECVHNSGIGLDYFTSRIDRLVLQANGQCSLVTQDKSRISHAAKSLLSGQQVDTNAPETRREGRYTAQGNTITLLFNDGSQEQGQVNANGIQIGNEFFEKVSDSTMLPPTHRLQSNMEDIAKGLKIAGAIGGATIKAVKTLQQTVQSAQSNSPTQPSQPAQSTPESQTAQSTWNASQGASANQPPQYQAQQPQQPWQPSQAQPTSTPPAQDNETHFCDQCGSPVRPGKRYCNHCGALLP